jgi:hypothetical protein
VLVFALPYPLLRVVWALGGTFGTTGEPLDLEPAVAWGAAIAGSAPFVAGLVLLADRGGSRLRAVFGLGSVVAGLTLAVIGGPAVLGTASAIARDGLRSTPGAGLEAWPFLVVYGSWFVTGLALVVAGWRYWARRSAGRPCGCRGPATAPTPPA